MNAPTKHPVTGLPQSVKIEDGEVITAPGFYDMDIGWYHREPCDGPAVSSSGLRVIFDEDRGPAHYWMSSHLNPDRIEIEPTEAMILGRAAHHLLLGEADFAKHFVVRPDEAPDGRAWNGNNNSCKAWMADQKAAGLTVLTPGDIEAIAGMSRGLANHPLVAESGVLNGDVEKSLIWKDADTGLWLKARPDVIPASSNLASDLKTTESVGYRKLMQKTDVQHYDMQAALVRMGFREVLGRELESFVLVYVEKKPPHCVRVVEFKPADMDLAETCVRAAIKLFAKCLERNQWPGPGGTIADAEYIELSDYARNRRRARIDAIAMEI